MAEKQEHFDDSEAPICKECKLPFTIPPAEAGWFIERALNLPKRCRECRKQRREQNRMAS